MKKLRLLLLDANVVIQLIEYGLWDQVVDKCEVLLARIVIEKEVKFYHGEKQDQIIDLSPDEKAGRIRVVEVEGSDLDAFLDKFDPIYLEKLDPGEAESLTYLLTSKDQCLICSGDAIVFRVLGLLQREHQGISLEEVLHKVGLSRKLASQFSKSFRDHWTKLGQQDMIRDTGLKKRPRKRRS